MNNYDAYVVPFFLNGELQYVEVYESEDDASQDIAMWTSAEGTTDFRARDSSPFGETGMWCVRVRKRPQWAPVSSSNVVNTRSTTLLHDEIVNWLRGNGGHVWSNVIAGMFSQDLQTVHDILSAAQKSGYVEILKTVVTILGPISFVRAVQG